jgi:capsid portal protein
MNDIKDKGNLYALNFGAIDLPKIKEVREKEWVFFGERNLYPQKLAELYNSSAMHKTAVDAKVSAIIGEGFLSYGDTVVNSKGETLNQIFEKCTLDDRVFGAYSLNVIWNKGGDRIAEIYHIPVNKIRSGKFDEMDDINEYYFSSDWTNPRKYKPNEIAAFNIEDVKGDKASQIYYVKTYNPEADYYGLPDYIGALNDIELDARISRFHNANISNGIAPSMSIIFKNGIPTAEERTQIYNDIDQSFSGEANAGKFFILFAEAGREPEITPIQNTNDTYYTTLEERVSSRILTAHRITSPLLLGIRSGGGLGSNKDEIVTAYAHFFSTVCQPVQKRLVSEFQFITKLMGFGIDLQIEQSKIDFDESIEGGVEEEIINND